MRGLTTLLFAAAVALGWFGGCSSSDSGGGSGAGGSAGSNQSGCDFGECFRAYDCVRQCGGEVVHSGCCPCVAPLIDNLDCRGDAMGGEAGQTTGADAMTVSAEGGACEPGTASTAHCGAVGILCTGTDLCCRCIDFPQTPSCGMQWSCALPKNNAADCPSEAPAEGSSCTALKVTCQYCTTAGPQFVRCTGADASGAWSEVTGLTCNN
jgi:hypothetical protein